MLKCVGLRISIHVWYAEAREFVHLYPCMLNGFASLYPRMIRWSAWVCVSLSTYAEVRGFAYLYPRMIRWSAWVCVSLSTYAAAPGFVCLVMILMMIIDSHDVCHDWHDDPKNKICKKVAVLPRRNMNRRPTTGPFPTKPSPVFSVVSLVAKSLASAEFSGRNCFPKFLRWNWFHHVYNSR